MKTAIFLRVSDLVSTLFTGKIERDRKFTKSKNPRADLMHNIMRTRSLGFQEKELLVRLPKYLTRRTGNIYITGVLDSLRVLRTKEGFVVSVVEYKTSRSGELSPRRREAAKFQAQIYAWLLEKFLPKEYKIHRRHWVEFIDLFHPIVIERIPVEYDERIEERIWEVVYRCLE